VHWTARQPRGATCEQLVDGVHRLVVAAHAAAALLAQAIELVDEQDAGRLQHKSQADIFGAQNKVQMTSPAAAAKQLSLQADTSLHSAGTSSTAHEHLGSHNNLISSYN
jgi:hypothetical protein